MLALFDAAPCYIATHVVAHFHTPWYNNNLTARSISTAAVEKLNALFRVYCCFPPSEITSIDIKILTTNLNILSEPTVKFFKES